ncbi:MAG TPA: copper amine oxidase N-terminal domain-containing protein, partial [Tissierellaceae bacterium]
IEDKNTTRFIYTPQNPKLAESEIFKIEAIENYKESKEDIVLGKDGKYVYVGKVIYSDIYDKDTTEKERYDVARDVLDGVEQLFEIDKNLNRLDVVLLNGKEYKLKDRIIKDENGTRFIPVAEVLRELGYKVEWNQKNFVVTSRKGNVESQIYTRENRYSINKALVILKDKAILKNGRTYVPVEYFSEVLNLDTSLVNNTLSIKTK